MHGNVNRTIFLLVALLGVALVDSNLVAPILPEIAESLRTAERMVGYTVVGYSLGAALGALCVGPLSDRLGRKMFLLMGGLLFVLGSLASIWAYALPAFFLARLVIGIAAGSISALTIASIADVVPYETRGRVMGYVGAAYFAAPILGIPLGAEIAVRFGWQANYVILSMLTLCVLVGLLFEFQAFPMIENPKNFNYINLLKTKSTLAGAGSAFFVTGGLVGFLLFLSLYLRNNFQLSLQAVSVVLSLTGITGIIGAYGGGFLCDRIGKVRIALISNAILSVCFFAVPFLKGALLYTVLGVIGLTAAARIAPLQSLITELVSKEHRGTFVAIRNTLSQIGGGVAAASASALYGYGFQYVCWLAATFTLMAIILLSFIDEPNFQPESSTGLSL